MNSQAVPEEAKEKGGDEHGPEANEAAEKIAAPGPLITLDRAENGAADEVAAEDKEDNHGLVARACKRIKDGEGEAVGGDLRIVDEEEIAPVLKEDEEGGQPTQKIEVY